VFVTIKYAGYRLKVDNNRRVYTRALQSDSNSNDRSFMLANKKYTLYFDKGVANLFTRIRTETPYSRILRCILS